MKKSGKYKRLGEIATIRRGLTYKKEDEVEKSKNIVLRSNNVDLETHQLVFDELKYLKDDLDIPEEKILKKGDLLMCMSNGSKIHLGKVALIEQNTTFAFGGFMSAIEHNQDVLDKFFYYTLISPNFKQYIKDLQDGANINNLKIRDIENFSIPIPSLLEQQHIVAYLDAEFTKIEALKANAEKQLQAAKDLFQAALIELLASKEGWVEKKLEEIATIRRGLTYEKGDEVEKSNKIVLRSNNVDLETHQLVFDELKYLDEDFDIPKDKILKKGDLLMCMSNGSKIHLGKVALIEQNTDFAFGGFMSAIEHNKNVLDKFFYYSLISPNFKQHIKKLQEGANINNLKIRDIESFSIHVPPLTEQQRIAERLDALSANVKALQTNYTETITLCNDLKQALLKQVFE